MAKQQISLAGKVAVITGSTRGIGRAIAERYGQAGARVVISSSKPEAVNQALLEMRAQGIVCEGMTCDVSDLVQVQALAQRAISVFGQIDMWVNNAGISGPFGPILDVPPEEWRRVIEVNVLGTYHGCISVLPHMIERREGKIINVSGGGTKQAQRFLGAYSTSKAAIVRLTDAFIRDYRDHPYVSFTILVPGMVPTDMINQIPLVGAGHEASKDLPRIMRIFGSSTAETADLAMRAVSHETDGVSGKVYEIMTRRRVVWNLVSAFVRRKM
ncbi:SDR family NAD(P)-dependent oxidoreductase [Candidatus Oscillochloris fontis]|uniref:SDR family NAD(P)-dependent oxidoreductase n=1 Tax=Candidatus Oscillochloris fontis TaxID=2496868 RepID=UPI001EE99772|nr:SDR family oxidoreductase [Candidatus Oscillochloris fontis]